MMGSIVKRKAKASWQGDRRKGGARLSAGASPDLAVFALTTLVTMLIWFV